MAANGILEFQGTERAIFRGSNSNIVIDTANSSFGVGVDTPTSNLHIVGKTSLQGDLNLVQVSNVANVTVNSNVVAEYTGPHDRPLRKYPEVALTSDAATASGYKGYIVTASSVYNTTSRASWMAFDYPASSLSTATAWASSTSRFNQSGIANSNDTFQGVNGPYIQLQLPNPILLDHFIIKTPADTGGGCPPKKINLYASNDNTTFTTLVLNEVLHGIPGTDSTTHVTTQTRYKYFTLQVTEMNPGTSVTSDTQYTWTRISDLAFYGHEEGSGSLDTTLKTVYNVPATTGTQLEVYYDAKDLTTMPSTVTDLSPNSNDGSVTGATLDTTDGIDSFKFDASSSQNITSTIDTSYWGTNKLHSVAFWFKADTVAGKYNIFHIGNLSNNESSGFWISDGRADNNAGNSLNWWFYGGDSTIKVSTFSWTLNTWYHIALTFDGSTKKMYVNGHHIDFSVGNVITTLPTGIPNSASLAVGSITNSGDYFDGSIANFRVYGAKTLNADQVKELYDYQKDYFLGSKSQVTLYKGHLGVGVTEPSGQLELAGDERLQEYPPRGMTGYSTHIEGHGVFEVSVSGLHQSSDTYAGWKAFNDNADGSSEAWITLDPSYNNGAQTLNKRLSSNTPLGEYIVLELPYKVKITMAKLHERSNDTDNAPSAGVFYGSNDGTSWTELKSFSGLTYDNTADVYSDVEINATEYFYKIALVVTNIGDTTSTWMGIGELRYFGTPGPTTLDKGSLSLTRSLDVPRVSRYDVDTETPRPEKLVLDFDTTVNSSPTDISGKGNHGTFNGGASYSAADKAFTGFPSSSANYINGTLSGVSGAYAHTQSYWINGADTTPRCPFTVGKEAGSYSYLNIWLTTSQWTLNSDGAAGGVWAETIYDNRWYHVVLTYDGGTSTDSYKLYIDGEYKTPTTAISINAPLALPSNPEYRIGRNDGVQWYNGMVSNPKVYSVVLEPSEVKKLYNLGRTGRSMVISDTAVGIGKVPEAQLDVRGVLKASVGLFQDKPFFVCDVARHGLKDIGSQTFYVHNDRTDALSSISTSIGCRWRLAATSGNHTYRTNNVQLVRVLNDTTSETSGVKVPYAGYYHLTHLIRSANTNVGTTFWVYSPRHNKYIQPSIQGYRLPWGGNSGHNGISNSVSNSLYLEEGDVVIFVLSNVTLGDNPVTGGYEQLVSLVMV